MKTLKKTHGSIALFLLISVTSQVALAPAAHADSQADLARATQELVKIEKARDAAEKEKIAKQKADDRASAEYWERRQRNLETARFAVLGLVSAMIGAGMAIASWGANALPILIPKEALDPSHGPSARFESNRLEKRIESRPTESGPETQRASAQAAAAS